MSMKRAAILGGLAVVALHDPEQRTAVAVDHRDVAVELHDEQLEALGRLGGCVVIFGDVDRSGFVLCSERRGAKRRPGRVLPIGL